MEVSFPGFQLFCYVLLNPPLLLPDRYFLPCHFPWDSYFLLPLLLYSPLPSHPQSFFYHHFSCFLHHLTPLFQPFLFPDLYLFPPPFFPDPLLPLPVLLPRSFFQSSFSPASPTPLLKSPCLRMYSQPHKRNCTFDLPFSVLATHHT